MDLKYKLKFEDFLKKNNIKDKNNILELFDRFKPNDLIVHLESLPQDDLTSYALECVCEELLITSSYKIERTGMKLGLHRMKKILKLFNNPEKNLKVIHIAGTNGKGSTSSYLKDVLKTKYRVGLYSSPGMISFNDRIRINDDFISYREAFKLFKLVQKTYFENNSDSTDNLSFFEVITVVALLYFNKEQCDFVIMEVGLGGQFDATNIFKEKLLSIITKIGLDHTNILGHTLEKIAYEKAGIIQENDNVIIYPANNNVIKVIKDICEEKNAKLDILDVENITIDSINSHGNTFSFRGEKYSTKMIGEHQIYNCSLALAALFNLRDRNIIEITNNDIQNAISKSTWAGRLEWIRENILLDGAHNNDGIDSLVNYLNKQTFPKLKILLGILSDKDYKDMIEKLKTIPAEFFITKVPIEIKESNLENLISSFNDTKIENFENYSQALKNLIPNLKDDEILLITGSLYLISATRSEILEKY
ncbi:bifunctional folylpolyglutamate synthase/dihydrofolate synthase [Gemella cuniculi]|uniref:bifunctional folylpolyglutamate synthase/dihydrofolate synthase n=1 Tax=Gemella cuniculi TaxID=150240 RepID=UPI0003FF06E7|nr:folylpolyglutamate synthase/dihydrofolate synthase family protein [Gemella cuniculi]